MAWLEEEIQILKNHVNKLKETSDCQLETLETWSKKESLRGQYQKLQKRNNRKSTDDPSKWVTVDSKRPIGSKNK